MKYFHRRIEEKSKDRSAAPVLIVALGDSVTEGSTKINVIEPDIVYHEQLKRLFEKKYPRCTFCVINAGVGGENAAQGLKRVELDSGFPREKAHAFYEKLGFEKRAYLFSYIL